MHITTPANRRAHLPAWAGDCVAAVLILTAAFLPFPGDEYRPGSILALAVIIAPAIALPFRRRWPIAVLAVVIALYGVAALTGTLSPGVVIAATIAMFGVGNRYGRRASAIVAGACVASVILLSLFAALGSLFDPRAIQFAIAVAFAAAAGDATRSRREFIEAVTERAERAEQTREAEANRRVAEERLRIARDLHDAVAHQISVISLNAGVATASLDTKPDKAREALGTIRKASRTVLSEIGTLLAVLRSDDTTDRAPTPQPGLQRIDELIAGFAESGLAVNVRVEGDLADITGATDLVAFRVLQEALTNAHKHGSEHRAHALIHIDQTGTQIVVTNPTVPTPTASSEERGGGHGLLGIRERAASVRGTVESGNTPGGYRLEVTLPAHPTED